MTMLAGMAVATLALTISAANAATFDVAFRCKDRPGQTEHKFVEAQNEAQAMVKWQEQMSRSSLYANRSCQITDIRKR
jgi:hypothetical protein